MNKAAICIPVIALISGLIGCAQLDQSIPDCENLREEIVELSKEDRQSRGFSLVKIRKPKTLAKSDNLISCSGSALWSDGDKTSITYKSYIDEDGDCLLYTSPSPRD